MREKNYDIADKAFYEWLLNRNNISQRNDYIRNIKNEYQISPVCGYFQTNETYDMFNDVDINKAYTRNLQDMIYFPVFSVFDIFLKYDGHSIEDYTQYIVYCGENTNETSILFDKQYSRCYGYKLNRIGCKYEVLFYRKPLKLNVTHSDRHIK